MEILNDFGCVILAAGDRKHPQDPGLGTKAKNLADFNGRPVIAWVVDKAIKAGLNPEQITLVIKPELSEHFRAAVPPVIRFAGQSQATGSVDALRAAIEQRVLPNCEHLLILMGDQPNLNPAKLNHFMLRHRKNRKLVTISTFYGNRNHPWFKKCGIIRRDVNGFFEAIVKSPIPAKKTQELHAGPYCFNTKWLQLCLKQLPLKHEGEIHVYVAAEAAAHIYGAETFQIGTAEEILGIDTFDALEHLRQKTKNNLAPQNPR
ncbi:hypothetical protein C4546_04640 [Candidatus Parcubacteria bacterium]|jgi:bifunctional N-acetylglucosamine-1-phosphate-uridyltransferase/glucosamine-1-phosphate-acetyltransferase GlmU-like protein|nr:MAG: hypothetical protein C4546_04640 [Candidatus Parcubacteria bacterium]